MSKNASPTSESVCRRSSGRVHPGVDPGLDEVGSPDPTVADPRVTRYGDSAIADPRATRSGGPVGGLAAYYRLRCIALEAAAAALERELERERRRFDEVVGRYEAILQEHGAEGTVTVSR